MTEFKKNITLFFYSLLLLIFKLIFISQKFVKFILLNFLTIFKSDTVPILYIKFCYFLTKQKF